MRVSELQCRDTRDFQGQVAASCSGIIDYVYRDVDGFVAHGNDRDVRITPTVKSRNDYDLFFHGVVIPFKGEVNLPEPSDFGVNVDEKAPEPAKEETPPTEGQPPAEQTPPKTEEDHSVLKS